MGAAVTPSSTSRLPPPAPPRPLAPNNLLHVLLHPGGLLLLLPPVLHRVRRRLFEILGVDDDFVLILAILSLGQHHGFVLLAHFETELSGSSRRGLIVLRETVLERHLFQLPSLKLCGAGAMMRGERFRVWFVATVRGAPRERKRVITRFDYLRGAGEYCM